MANAVIVVPGVMGSELKKGDELIWPGKAWEVLTPYSKMKELLEPDLAVGDIIRSVVKSVYSSLLEALEFCGFKEVDEKPTLVVCPYDWRKDNASSASRLGECIQSLRKVHDGDLRIDIVAHSMGGLVSRYFLESGHFSEENCPGFANVASLITMGTPHGGAPLALAAALGQVKRLFLSAEQVKQLASNDNFPSLYQLMPAPNEPFVWNSASNARLGTVDVFDDNLAQALSLSKANLASARAFREALDMRRKPASVEYFCFVGSSVHTYNHLRVDLSAGKPLVQPIAVPGGGDGTVPLWSSSLPGARQLAVGGEHGTLFNDDGLLSALGALLGKAGYLAAGEGGFKLALGSEVVEPKARLQVLVIAPQATTEVDAEIVFVKMTGADGKPLDAPTPLKQTYPVHYAGAPVESFSLFVDTPTYGGAYRLELQAAGKSLAPKPPVLLVQQA